MANTVVSSWNDFDPLRHVIVGRADFTCIPPTEPAGVAEPAAASDVGALPLPLPEPAAVAEPAAAGEVDVLPIPIPEPAEETWEEPAVVEEVEAVEPMIEPVEDEQLDG